MSYPDPSPAGDSAEGYPDWLAFEPSLVPPPSLMHKEAVTVLEDWFRWAEEWHVLLRAYAGMGGASRVLEIGCGLGRIAYALRITLGDTGSYDGFDICRDKIEFLDGAFTRAHPNFRFAWADVHNSCYNPQGRIPGAEYRFPYRERSFDVVFAASVFTHMVPRTTARYLREAARVLRPRGRCLFSFLLMDGYRRGHPRPLGFADPYFDLDHAYDDYAPEEFAIARPDDPDQLTAYHSRFVERLAAQAGLALAQRPLPGLWSGTASRWIGTQDLIVLRHAHEEDGSAHRGP